LGLLWMRGEAVSLSIVLAAALIVGAALLGARAQQASDDVPVGP
jgi:hypothetical protein